MVDVLARYLDLEGLETHVLDIFCVDLLKVILEEGGDEGFEGFLDLHHIPTNTGPL